MQMHGMLTSECKKKLLSEIPKLFYEVSEKSTKWSEWPSTTDLYFAYNMCMTVCLQNQITVGILMLALCSGHRSCYIFALDLVYKKNTEKLGDTMKLAIEMVQNLLYGLDVCIKTG